MKQTIIFAAALALMSAVPALAQTTDSDKLLQRLATPQSGVTAQVFVGKLPTDMPKIPLPDASIIGSVRRRNERQNGLPDSYELFYDAVPQTMAAYQATLMAAGWTPRQTAGGFVPSKGLDFAFYCKASSSVIMIRTGEEPGDVRISVMSPNDGSGFCDTAALARVITSGMEPALPSLHAPPGITMSVPNIDTPNGRSAAYIQNGSSAGSLLDAFAKQMIACGWQAGEKSTGTAIAAQAFQRFDDKKTLWRALIAVNAISGKPGDFAAYVEASHGEGPTGNFHSVIIKSP